MRVKKLSIKINSLFINVDTRDNENKENPKRKSQIAEIWIISFPRNRIFIANVRIIAYK